MQLFATTAWGIETLTAEELTRLGAADVRATAGGVHFAGDHRILYRALLGLRTATRVLRPLREFAAAHAEMLYSQVRRVRWEDWIAPTGTLAVSATLQGRGLRQAAPAEAAPESAAPQTRPSATRGRRSERRTTDEAAGREAEPRKGLIHSHYAALKIKDAICDRLRRERGARPNVDVEKADLRVHAHFANGRCTLSLDAAGTSLHERGYRKQSGEAPLRETLAAAVVLFSGWDGEGPLLDPMCGAGTLAIEAALWGRRKAPGLGRRFACWNWPDFDQAIWDEEAARARENEKRLPVPIVARDVDRRVLDLARDNARRAGVENDVRFECTAFEESVPPAAGAGRGTLLINPPYGERLGSSEEVAALYQRMGAVLQERYRGWTAWVLVGNLTLARQIPLRAAERIKLMNGALECRLLRFDLGP